MERRVMMSTNKYEKTGRLPTLRSRTAKILDKALHCPEATGFTSSESGSAVDVDPTNTTFKNQETTFRNINKDVENWLIRTEQPEDRFIHYDINEALQPVKIFTESVNLSDDSHTGSSLKTKPILTILKAVEVDQAIGSKTNELHAACDKVWSGECENANYDADEEYHCDDDTDWEQSSTDSDIELAELVQINLNNTLEKPIPEKLPINSSKTIYKKTYCTYCDSLVVSKHFSRHLQQRHKEKKTVQLMLDEKDSKKKKEIIMAIRNKGNLTLKRRNGTIIPKKQMPVLTDKLNDENYMICSKCKGHFRSTYIVRHSKTCIIPESKDETHPKVESYILSLNAEYQKYINDNPLRREILKKLRFDSIGKIVVSDPLILEYGIQLLETNKNVIKRTTVARNKMRECARFLLEARCIIPSTSEITLSIIDILKPEYIDYLVQAVKQASKYSREERSYGAPSYALHQGKTFKDLIDIAIFLVCKKDSVVHSGTLKNYETILGEFRLLRDMIEKNWGRLVGSLALKDLNIKKSRNHAKKLLPLTEDVMKLRKYCLEKAKKALTILNAACNPVHYSILVEVTFILLLLHNRKRVGDIQFIELSDVTNNQTRTDQKDEVLLSLTPTEKILTKFYKKINTIGKGSKEQLVLIPRDIQGFVDCLVTHRHKYISLTNIYFFPKPSTDEWINGCYIITKYSKECGAKEPDLIRSSRLRKHIATMMQIMDLRDNEIGQLASFLGHTEKTHKEFYRLPKDILMIAKVSKVLLKLEKGELDLCKNKRMEEIDVELEEPEISESFSDKDVLPETDNFTISIPCSGITQENESSDEIPIPTRKENCTAETVKGKKAWSTDELSLIKQHFKNYLKSDSLYPSSGDIHSFLKNHKCLRTVNQIKSKIQHLKKMLN